MVSYWSKELSSVLDSSHFMQDIKQFLVQLNIQHRDLTLYRTAFTHRSFLNEEKTIKESNERLEFLGDSVLSFIISSHLYESRKSDQEGELTNLRAYMVKTDSLATVAQKLKLGEQLRLSKGEELSGGRINPQLLANTYEALLGAIYLDLGVERAKQFVRETLTPQFEAALKSGAPKDAKSELQEVVQDRFQVSPKYKILETSGPDHAKHFKVGVFVQDDLIGEGRGANKQTAEEQAAKVALSSLS